MTEEWLDLRIIFLILHVLGPVLGAGAAFTGGILFLTSVRNKTLTASEIRIFRITGSIVWLGLLIASVSGVDLVLQRPEIFLYSEKLWAKITVIGVIVVNGLVFHLVHQRPSHRQILNQNHLQMNRLILLLLPRSLRISSPRRMMTTSGTYRRSSAKKISPLLSQNKHYTTQSS